MIISYIDHFGTQGTVQRNVTHSGRAHTGMPHSAVGKIPLSEDFYHAKCAKALLASAMKFSTAPIRDKIPDLRSLQLEKYFLILDQSQLLHMKAARAVLVAKD